MLLNIEYSYFTIYFYFFFILKKTIIFFYFCRFSFQNESRLNVILEICDQQAQKLVFLLFNSMNSNLLC